MANSYINIPTAFQEANDEVVQFYYESSLGVYGSGAIAGSPPFGPIDVVLPYIGRAPMPANARAIEMVSPNAYFLKNGNQGIQHTEDSLKFYDYRNGNYLTYLEVKENDYNNEIVVFSYIKNVDIICRVLY